MDDPVFHPIPEILDELRAGRMVIVVDDGDRVHLTAAELGALLSRGSHLTPAEKIELRTAAARTDVYVTDR